MAWNDVVTALHNFWDVLSECINFIGTNAALLAMFAASLIPIGLYII